MASWPTGWQRNVLRASGVPVTQFALDVISAWQKGTPTEPWTNNPLGMAASGSGAPAALHTPYAAFPSMQAFQDAFKRALSAGQGHSVQESLIMGQSYADAWREIHGLCWPANKTESEYPCPLMDLVSAAYTDKLSAPSRPPSTTTGSTHAPPEVHAAMRKQAQLLNQAANHIDGAAAGMAHVIKGMN